MKRLADTQNSFTANGVKYLVHSELTIARFIEFEKLQIEIGFGSDFDNLFASVGAAYADLNKSKFADASVKLHNILHAASRNKDERSHPVLLLCSLFICKEGEDLAKWDEPTAIEKIQDWASEGIAVSDFFGLARSLVAGLQDAWNWGSLNISAATTESHQPNP